MFGFKMPQTLKIGAEGSPLSKMGTSQQLQALGAAFGGDDKQLASILGSLGGQGQGGGGGMQPPILNADGVDISAAFGGQVEAPQQSAGPSPLDSMLMRLGRGFGFGRKGR